MFAFSSVLQHGFAAQRSFSVFVLIFLMAAIAGCGGSRHSLTEGQLAKLDPALRRLVQGRSSDPSIPSTTRPDGTVAYAVFMRVTDADPIREAGLPINSVSGNVLTARLSKPELRKAVRLDAVTSIESSGEATPQANE